MNDNRLFVRELAGVVTAILAVTVLALRFIPHGGTPVVADAPATAAAPVPVPATQ